MLFTCYIFDFFDICVFNLLFLATENRDIVSTKHHRDYIKRLSWTFSAQENVLNRLNNKHMYAQIRHGLHILERLFKKWKMLSLPLNQLES